MTRPTIRFTGGDLPRSTTSKRSAVLHWHAADRTQWEMQFDFETRNRRRVPVGIHLQLSAKHRDKSITTRGVREIPVTAIFEEWLRLSTTTPKPTVDTELAGPKKGGPLSHDVLVKVAELYRSALNRGEPPNLYIAREMGISRSTATKRIVRARKQSLLGPTTPGKRGESE